MIGFVDCPGDETLARFFSPGMLESDRKKVLAHLGTCDGCRQLVAELAREHFPRVSGKLRPTTRRPGKTRLIRAGARFDDYVLERCIGRGGMGIVWDATRSDGTAVAIKFLSESTPELVGRLRREASVLSQLAHPNIVRVLAIFEGNRPNESGIVMERLHGETLEDRFQSTQPSSVGALANWFVQVLSALEAVHRVGVAHRDLKPRNVFLTSEGRAVLLDFGLAKLLGEWQGSHSVRMTTSGTAVGTPAYMPPESGTRDLDWRGDVWAFGVLAYRALVGRLPFLGRTFEVVRRAACDRRAAALPEAKPELPRHVTETTWAALSVNPTDRPSVSQLRVAWRSLCE